MQNKTKAGSRGFTLIAALLMMALLSAISIGLLMMVNTEAKVGSHDLQNDMAYRAAEGGMEQLTAQMANTVAGNLNPTAANFTALNGLSPSGDPTVAYPVYTVTPTLIPAGKPGAGNLQTTTEQIPTGPYAGLNAQIISAALNVTARRIMGDEVTMTRNVEIALIPVFQFGFFSNGDLGFFSSPTLSFNGRIHTNGDLYLGVSNAATLAFNDKITVAGNVVGAFFPNGVAANAGNNDGGPVYILDATAGCASMMPIPPGAPGPNCIQFPTNTGSVVGTGGNPLLSGAPNPNLSAQDPSWPATSLGTFGGFITDGNYGNLGGTGAKALTLPFVSGAGAGLNASHEIIRRPPMLPAPESPLTVLGQSRLANEAQIRVLLSDTPAEDFLPDSDSPLNDPGFNDPPIRLDSSDPIFGAAAGGVPVFGVGNTFFAMATDTPIGTAKGYDPPGNGLLRPAGFVSPAPWPLIGGYLRVEAKSAATGNWVGVTQEWLKLGFARGIQPPGFQVPVHPDAILIFQELADRDGNGQFTVAAHEDTTVTGANAQYNWFPINLYDAREGENWDPTQNNTNCTANGVMNAVELDVGNLKRWLTGITGVTGPLVQSATQNGYILYFSDRRGMQLLTPAVERNGEYGFEDTINLASSGVPDGAKEPINPIQPNYSPEDVNGNGVLDNYGVVQVGDAFGLGADTDGGAAGTNTGAANRNPYKTRIPNCYTTGRKNRVTGARHVLKLVDGAITKLPTKPDGTGGFTVASENPVYIQGDYNSDAADTVWAAGVEDPRGHAAAGVIADAVTLLSNNWLDAGYPAAAGAPAGSMSITANSQGKNAVTTRYRVAIAGGVGMAFSNPTCKGATNNCYYGTDGGVHNFLRFLEDWGGNNTNPFGLQTLYYEGSLVKLYNSVYSTGTFKCCNDVYNPPSRHYVFDPNFLAPAGLPPGTPMFRDVESTSYRQDFNPDVTNTQ